MVYATPLPTYNKVSVSTNQRWSGISQFCNLRYVFQHAMDASPYTHIHRVFLLSSVGGYRMY